MSSRKQKGHRLKENVIFNLKEMTEIKWSSDKKFISDKCLKQIPHARQFLRILTMSGSR